MSKTKTADEKLNEELFGDMDGLVFGAEDIMEENNLVYSFNCPPMDVPMGGGIVAGKIYELMGEESHGKSTFALEMAKIFCDFWKDKGEPYRVLWVESESAFDVVRANVMGCDMSKFIRKNTDIFETGRDTIKDMLQRSVKKKMHLFIVWDTLAAVSTLKEKEASAIFEEGDEEDDGKSKLNRGGMTEKPRLIKSMLRDITTILGETGSTFIVVNQVITQVGKYGAPLDSPGGRGLRHFASIRARVSKVDEDDYVGADGQRSIRAICSEISFAKNKLTGFTKYKIALWINLTRGLDRLRTRLEFMKKSKLFPSPAGGWTTIKIPTGYATKPQDKIEMTEVKFQSAEQLGNLTLKYPYLLDWMDYLIYKAFCSDMLLVKVKNIDKLWVYEEKFHGKRLTKLTDEEMRAANLMFADLITQSDAESPPDKGSGGTPPPDGKAPAKTPPPAKKPAAAEARAH